MLIANVEPMARMHGILTHQQKIRCDYVTCRSIVVNILTLHQSLFLKLSCVMNKREICTCIYDDAVFAQKKSTLYKSLWECPKLLYSGHKCSSYNNSNARHII